MIKCQFCWAWCPKEAEGKGYRKGEAFCKVQKRPVIGFASCSRASMQRPWEKEGAEYVTEQDYFKYVIDVEDDEDTAAKQKPSSKPVRKNTKQVSATVRRAADSEFSNTPELYKHQKEAFEYFKDAKEIALFFEMGVGKSATVLSIVAERFKRGDINALLVIAPNDVHVQWATEQIPLWLGVPYQLQCLFGRGGQRVAYPFDKDEELLQVVCVNVDTFSTPSKWQDIAQWANSMNTFIVLDEATVIKNVNAKRTQRILYEFNDTIRKGKTILSSTPKTVSRAILTGTPVTNGAMDLWAMMEFLKPNYFGKNWYAFQNYFGMHTKIDVEDPMTGRVRSVDVPLTEEWWHKIRECVSFNEANYLCGCSLDTYRTVINQTHYEGPYKHAAELREAIKPVSIFKLLVDCVDMPPQNYITRELQMNDAQAACYKSMVEEFIAVYDNHKATALNKLSVMIRLQQLSSGFICDKEINEVEEDEDGNIDWSRYDVIEDEVKWIGKSNPKLDALYRDVEELSKPIIIITRFTAEASRIYEDLSKNHTCCLITGWKRVGSIEEFKEGKYQVMVANIAAIARGFNLQNSHVMCFYSNTFSLELRLQAEGRVFRLGQKNPCEYIDYINKDTVDEKIVSSLLLKRNLLDYIRGSEVKDIIF